MRLPRSLFFSAAAASLSACGGAAPPAGQLPPPLTTSSSWVHAAREPSQAAAGPAATSPLAPEALVYVKAGRLFDGTGSAYRKDVVIVIAGARVQNVGAASEVVIPAGAKVVDLSADAVLPGLIDAHVHLSHRADHQEEIYAVKDTPFDRAFAATVDARVTLEAGFTTVRDVGSPPFLAVDLRKAIDTGFLAGPRVVASGPAISITGGHNDFDGFAPQVSRWMFPEEKDFAVADGVDAVRHVVRAQMKYGVDVIKICASGGVFSRGDQPGSPQFTVDELRAAVEEAHAGGRKVAAHAHGAQAIKNAVVAGVDSIEHGSFLDDEGIRLMKEHGTWLVADIYNDDFILSHAAELKIPEEAVAKEKTLGKIQRENFARAVRAGVKIAFGTDAGVYPHGDNARQLAFMVRYGMTAASALRSATSDDAALLGRADVGQIVEGRYADLVAVPGDPLADVSVLEHVAVVIKGGVVVKDAR